MKPNFLPRASTLAARSTPGERKTKIGIPGLVSCNYSRLPGLLNLNSTIANVQLDFLSECAYSSTPLAAGFDVSCIKLRWPQHRESCSLFQGGLWTADDCS